MNLWKATAGKMLLAAFFLIFLVSLSGRAYALDLDFRQCKNDYDNSGIFEACEWITGALETNNSRYAESDGVPQRLIFEHTSLVPNDTHTVTFRYDFTKQTGPTTAYGYDFLVDPDHTVPASLLNYCGNLPPFVTLSECETALGTAFNVPVISDNYDQVPQREHPPSRNIFMACSSACSATVLSISHSNDPTPGTNLLDDCFQNTCGTSTVDVTVQFQFANAVTNDVYMWFAGELAPAEDPDGAGPAIGWGTDFGASSYPGASLHMRVVDLDGDPGGARDNALLNGVIEQSHTADLSVEKTCPGTVVKGNNVSYTINVTNSDTNPPPEGGTATSVYIDDTLPTGVTFVSASISQGTCELAPVLGIEHCDIGTMQPGDVVTATIVVNVPSNYSGPSPISDSVMVNGAVIDPGPGINTVSCPTTVTSPGLPDTDVSVDKTCPMSDEVAGGDTFDYTITVTNNSGSVDAGSVTLTDSLPGGVTFVSSNPDSTPPVPTCTESGGIVTCDLGPIAHGDHVDVTITVQANASTRGMITNTASVSLENQSNTSSNSSDHCDTNVVGEADLSIEKSPCAGTVDAGSQLVYTITVHNYGPSTATDTQVLDTLPSGVTFVSATESQGTGCTFNMVDTVTCDVGTIAPSGSATITLTVLVNNDTTGTITNSANVHSDETDPDTDVHVNTIDCDNEVNTPTEPGINLSVEKQCPGSDVTAGNNFSYTVTVKNNTEPDDGSTDATGVTLTDTLPAGVTFVSSNPDSTPPIPTCTESGGIVTCDLGTIAAGGSVAVTINVMADPSTRGQITNGVTVAGGQADPDTDNNTDSCNTNVTGDDDLHITKTDSPDPVKTGDNLTYTINVSNDGPSDSTNVVVFDTLPAGVSFVSAIATQGSGCTNNGNVSVTCNLGTINPGGSAIITIVVQVNIKGDTTITNTATVTSTEDPGGESDSEDTGVIHPVTVPTLTDWGKMIFVMLAGLGAAYYLRRQRRANM
jgi:uncharacterized repeat protein (TIGR01451 family)